LGVTDFSRMPEEGLPEVAMVGRSNVGKSTLINRLTGRKNLAKTSNTPGRTQEINFFKIALFGEGGERTLLLSDLPGFGYAKFSKEKRENLNQLTVQYLRDREELKVVCLLNDSRRKPERDEIALQELLYSVGVHLLVVVTKFDKLKQKEKHKNLKAISEGYGLESSDLIVSGEKDPGAALWERVLMLL